MVRITTLLLLTLSSFLGVFAQGLDIPTTELLIEKHKNQHNALEDRNTQEIKHNGVSLLVKDISTKYEQLHKELNKQYSLFSQLFNLGISGAQILNELKSLSKAIPPFLSYGNKIRNPYVLLKYVQAGKKIYNEIDFITKAVASLPPLRLNARELHEIISLLQDHISQIRFILTSYTVSIRGQSLYSDLYRKPQPLDYAKVAKDVSKEFFGK